MSKIGRMPIMLTDGITVSVNGTDVSVSGPKGNTVYKVPKNVVVRVDDGKVSVQAADGKEPNMSAMLGLTRALLNNTIRGVSQGFEKKLELAGVGYRAQMQGRDLVLSLGFSHPVKFTPKDGITISVADNVITIAGSDKALVGEMAAEIRAVKPPEPYKGKGIKYQGEHIRRKAGKAAKAVGGK